MIPQTDLEVDLHLDGLTLLGVDVHQRFREGRRFGRLLRTGDARWVLTFEFGSHESEHVFGALPVYLRLDVHVRLVHTELVRCLCDVHLGVAQVDRLVGLAYLVVLVLLELLLGGYERELEES